MNGKVAFVFPGQGSQYVGMGKDLCEQFPVAREVFTQADETLGFSLSKLCFSGPEAELNLTENTQPAILTASVAALRVLETETPLRADFAAGHSLGGVVPGGPAAKHGLKEGDIILSVEQKEVRSRPELYQEMWKKRPGERIRFKILREEQSFELEVIGGDRADRYRS